MSTVDCRRNGLYLHYVCADNVCSCKHRAPLRDNAVVCLCRNTRGFLVRYGTGVLAEQRANTIAALGVRARKREWADVPYGVTDLSNVHPLQDNIFWEIYTSSNKFPVPDKMKNDMFCKIEPEGSKLHLECNHFIKTGGDKLLFSRITEMTPSQRTKETFLHTISPPTN